MGSVTNMLGKFFDHALVAAITAFLGYMAFDTFWHAGLFGFIAFLISVRAQPL